MAKLSMSKMMGKMYEIEKSENIRRTLLGIGPMSSNLIEAVFDLAKSRDFPVMFIASRNQVDADELGGGYVNSWNQQSFRRDIEAIARRRGFDGLYYLCRDHGGPWQRDDERKARLPADRAMAIGKKSYLRDLEAGFDLLHIDPTKVPTTDGAVPMKLVLDYTVELVEYCETERKRLGIPEVAYEVGTEETNGGLTGEKEYRAFIDTLVERLRAKGLPLPVFIVGQTGTLTRLTENVGHFDPDTAMRLSKAARVHGIGLKEHNGDYLPDFILDIHPALGITAANVAPEYGTAETLTLLRLGEVERFLREKGLLRSASDFTRIFTEASIASERWRKWMVGDKAAYTVAQVLAEPVLAAQIVKICGHYTFNDDAVRAEIGVMFKGLESTGLDPHRIVIDGIMKSIERYVDGFNLAGLTSRLLQGG